MSTKINITESDIRRIVTEAVSRVVSEGTKEREVAVRLKRGLTPGKLGSFDTPFDMDTSMTSQLRAEREAIRKRDEEENAKDLERERRHDIGFLTQTIIKPAQQLSGAIKDPSRSKQLEKFGIMSIDDQKRLTALLDSLSAK